MKIHNSLYFAFLFGLSLLIPITFTHAGESDAALSQAYQNQQSNLQIQGDGIVIKVLPDDTRGSQHQRFILFIPKGHTAYDALKPMISSDRLNIKAIRAHWDEILGV